MNAEAEDIAVSEPAGELTLKGFSRPVTAYNIRGLDNARITVMSGPTLAGLDENDRYKRFDDLQQRLASGLGRDAAQPRG
jgi:hypothetical protein